MYCIEVTLLYLVTGYGVLKTVGSGVVGFLVLENYGDHAMLPQRPFNRCGGPSIVGPFNPRQAEPWMKNITGWNKWPYKRVTVAYVDRLNDQRIGRGNASVFPLYSYKRFEGDITKCPSLLWPLVAMDLGHIIECPSLLWPWVATGWLCQYTHCYFRSLTRGPTMKLFNMTSLKFGI
jgi:hypothetical protein